jgi:hypothetical protein
MLIRFRDWKKMLLRLGRRFFFCRLHSGKFENLSFCCGFGANNENDASHCDSGSATPYAVLTVHGTDILITFLFTSY